MKAKSDDTTPETPETEEPKTETPVTEEMSTGTDDTPKPDAEQEGSSPTETSEAKPDDNPDAEIVETGSTVPELRRPAADAPTDDTTEGADTVDGGSTPDTPDPLSAPHRPEKRSSLPMFFGGLIAGILGAVLLYGAAKTGIVDLQSQDAINQQRAQDSQITDLSGRLDDLGADLGALREAGSSGVDDLRTRIAALTEEMAALKTRIEEIEVQPIPEAELPQEVVQAYERRFADMQAGLDARLAEIEAAASRASEVEAAAEARANAAAARAALAEVNGALQNGGPYAQALEEIASRTDTAIPDILSRNATDGIPSAAALAEGFPAAARNAIDASLSSMAETGEIGGMQAFLRSQFGARSLEPREGDDPDAILSRAEAAMREGDIDAAIAEIDNLPEAGRAEMTEWVEMATLRRDALAAADTLAQSLNES